MKKYMTIIFLFLFNVVYSIPESIQSAFPTFKWQIENNIGEGIDKTELLTKLKTYLQNPDAEMLKGLKMVLFESEYRDIASLQSQQINASSPRKKANYALELFLHLVNKDCFQEGDSITFALALANNWLYSIATPDARIAIKEDIVKHYHYYLKIVKWQEALPIKIQLKKYPLLPKLIWSNRYIYMDNTRKMTLNDYREFIDTMETLEGFHQIILENKLHTGYQFKTIAGKIISFGSKHNIYRGYIDRYIRSNTLHKLKPDVLRDYNAGEYETFYYGRKRKWMFYKWMNYQYKRYRQTGFTRGDCITFSRVQAALFKACGIPASSVYRVTYFTPSTSDHLFVFYYNAFQNKWEQHDYIFKRDVKTKVKFPRIRWHHLMKGFREETEEYTTNSKKNALFLRGIENWHFEQLVFNPNPITRTLMFDHPQAIYTRNDADGDGILDEIETKFGLNPGNPDTDGDGYSDLWELEHGYNPLDSNSPGRLNSPVIDGISDNGHLSNNVVSATSDEGNYSAYEQIYNVKSVFARVIKNELFLTVTFYNDIRKNGSPYHTFKIVSTGNSRDSYSLLLTKKIYFKKGREKLAATGIEYASIKTLNVVIPLQVFTGASSLSITYYGYGKKGRRKSASAKRSKTLEIQL